MTRDYFEPQETLAAQRNKLAKRVNQQLRQLMKNEQLGTTGTVDAIDRIISDLYGKSRSPVSGVSSNRFKEKGKTASQAEIDALNRILSWKSYSIKGIKTIHKQANERFRKWGYTGKDLTPQQISNFFGGKLFAQLENLYGSDASVRIMSEAMNDKGKLAQLEEFLANDTPIPEKRNRTLCGERLEEDFYKIIRDSILG